MNKADETRRDPEQDRPDRAPSLLLLRQGRDVRQQRVAREQQDAAHVAAEPANGAGRAIHGRTVKVSVCTRCLAAGKVQRAPRGAVATT